MNLELKHLAPYLPYRLKISSTHTMHAKQGIGNINHVVYLVNKGYSDYKPILRPLSDLHKLIDWNKDGELTSIGHLHCIEKVNEDGDEFYAEQFYVEYTQNPSFNLDITYFNWWLFEHHFDVFGLIEQDLAIDINTLK